MREYSKLKKNIKRELQVRLIRSKLEIADIVHWKCVFLPHNIVDARKQQCCVMCDKTSWLVWNFNMVQFNLYVFELAYNKMSVHSLHYDHSQSYTSFLKRRHYTSLKSSQFLQMYTVLIAQGKESKLFWNVNAYFTKWHPLFTCTQDHEWNWSINDQSTALENIPSSFWWWKWHAEQQIDKINIHSLLQWKTWVFPFWMPFIRNVKKSWMIGMYHIYVYSKSI